MGNWAERTKGKAVASRPSKVVDCGTRQAKLQLAARKELVDPATNHTTQSSSTGK